MSAHRLPAKHVHERGGPGGQVGVAVRDFFMWMIHFKLQKYTTGGLAFGVNSMAWLAALCHGEYGSVTAKILKQVLLYQEITN